MSELFIVEELDQVTEQTPEGRIAFQENLARLMRDNMEFIPWPTECQDEEDDERGYGKQQQGDYRVQYLLPNGALLEITQQNDWEEDRMFETESWHEEDSSDEDNHWWVATATTDWTVRIYESGLNDNGEPWSIQHEFDLIPQSQTEENTDFSQWRVFHNIKAKTPEEISAEADQEAELVMERLEEDGKPIEYDEYSTDDELEDDEFAEDDDFVPTQPSVEDRDYDEESRDRYIGVNESTMAVFNKTFKAMEAHQEERAFGYDLLGESELFGLNRFLESVDETMLVRHSVDHHAE